MTVSVEILENLSKFIAINNERLEAKLSTLCRTDKQEVVRQYLPCANTNAQGEHIIKCEDCPFSSVEAGKETIVALERIIKKQKVRDILQGAKEE